MNKFKSYLIKKLGGELPTKKRNMSYGEFRLFGWLEHYTKEDLIELIMTEKEKNPSNYIVNLIAAEHEIDRLNEILKSDYHSQKDLNRAKHMADLERKVKVLQEEVRKMQLSAEQHNAKNYATGLIVRCTGCVGGQPFKGEELTWERVKEVRNIANRLEDWYRNNQKKLNLK